MKEIRINHSHLDWLSSTCLGLWLLTSMVFFTGTSSAAEISVQTAIENEQVLAIDWWVQGADAQPVERAELLLDGQVIETPPPLLAPDAALPACYLFMVDTSLSMKGQLDTAVIPLLKTLIEQKPPQHVYAIGRFATELTLLAPFSDDTETLGQTAETLTLQGQRTELFSAILEGVRELAECQGYRRVMVLLSDGDAEDDPMAYTRQDAAQGARQQEVGLYSIGFNDTIKLQILRRLAQDTGARHWSYQADETAELAAQFMEHTDTGGQWRISLAELPAAGGDLTLRVHLNDDQQLQAPLDITLPQRTPPSPPWLVWLQQRFPAVPEQAWVPGLSATAGILLLLLLLVGLWLWRRRRRNKPQASDSTDHPVIPREPLAAIRTGNQIFVMDKYSISIGALPENDLVIDDPTVSRHQATLDYQDGVFHLTDRGSTNASLVNGKAVQHGVIKYGDELQFGDWRGVFEALDRP